MHHQNEFVLFARPLSPHNRRIDDIVPPLATLPAESPRQEPGNDHPVLRAVLLNFFAQSQIFLFGPLGAAAGVHWICYGAAQMIDVALARRGLLLVWRNAKGLRRVSLLHHFSLAPWRHLADFFQIKPSLKAADFRLVSHKFAQSVPRLFTVNIN